MYTYQLNESILSIVDNERSTTEFLLAILPEKKNCLFLYHIFENRQNRSIRHTIISNKVVRLEKLVYSGERNGNHHYSRKSTNCSYLQEGTYILLDKIIADKTKIVNRATDNIGIKCVFYTRFCNKNAINHIQESIIENPNKWKIETMQEGRQKQRIEIYRPYSDEICNQFMSRYLGTLRLSEFGLDHFFKIEQKYSNSYSVICLKINGIPSDIIYIIFGLLETANKDMIQITLDR